MAMTQWKKTKEGIGWVHKKRKWQSNNKKQQYSMGITRHLPVFAAVACVRLAVSAPVLVQHKVHVQRKTMMKNEKGTRESGVMTIGCSKHSCHHRSLLSIVCLINNMQTTNNFSYYKLNITREVSWERGRRVRNGGHWQALWNQHHHHQWKHMHPHTHKRPIGA